MSNRSARLDNIKGLMIVLVVFGHVLELLPPQSWTGVYVAIYLVHMPVFVFVSGYLTSLRRTPGELVRELVLLYGVAQVAWCGFLWLGTASADLPPPTWAEMLGLVPSQALWFIFSLFVWRLLAPALAEAKRPLLWLLCLCGFAAMAGRTPLDLTLSASRTVVFWPFFAAGLWSRLHCWRLTAAPRTRLDPLLLAGGCAWLAGLTWWVQRMHPGLAHFAFPYEVYQVSWKWGVAFRLGAFLGALAIIRALFVWMSERDFLLTALGRQSLAIFLGHFYVIQAYRMLEPAGIAAGQFWLIPLLTLAGCALGWSPIGAWFEQARATLAARLFVAK
jgi:fucose 4-O-acetylase-like acetyltransferase